MDHGFALQRGAGAFFRLFPRGFGSGPYLLDAVEEVGVEIIRAVVAAAPVEVVGGEA